MWFSVGLSIPVAGQAQGQIPAEVAAEIAAKVSEEVETPLQTQFETPSLVVNEVFYRGKDTRLEFVEVFNTSATAIDLSDFEFSDSRRKPVPISDSPYRLDPGDYAVITRDAAAFDTRFSFPSRIEIERWPALNNSGDAVILWINGAPVDSVVYSPSWGGNDVSIERIDPAGLSSVQSNWAESFDRQGGTPGSVNSVYAPDVGPPRIVFCEEVAERTLAVYFSEPLSPSSVVPSSFRFESGAVAHDATLDETRQIVFLTVISNGLGSWISVSGISDGSGNVLAEQQIAIAWLPDPGELVLNEIMYEPLANDLDGLANQPEYVEILSTAHRSLSIRSVVLTNYLREDGTRDTTALSDRRLTIDPGTFLLVYARADPSEDPLEAFPEIDRSDPNLVLLPIRASSLSLSNNGDKIRLERWGGIVVDEVEYAPSWHLAERVGTRGVSLERISVAAPTQNPSNWSSSVDPAGGTPGADNSILFEVDTSPEPSSLSIEPSPFSPDGDGFEDAALITLTLGRPTAVIRVWIFDLSGRTVIELEQARPVGPSASLIWDGRNWNGDLMRTGVYIILAEAVDVAGNHVARYKKPVVLVRP